MLRGTHKIIMVVLGLYTGFSSAYAFQTIAVTKTAKLPLSENYRISGANAIGDSFFVVNNTDAEIYQLTRAQNLTNSPKSSLVPYKNLSTLNGYYSYAKNISGEDKFDLEGVTFCQAPKNAQNGGLIFYLVNGKTGDILRVQGDNLQKLELNYENFPNFRYEVGNDGFMGVTVDCSDQKLFVAKQKNPNIVFAIDLNQKAVTRSYDLSSGSDLEDDISDLFFNDGQLYVLQKNRASILVINPAKNGQDIFLKNYDYSIVSDLTMSSEDVGIAEGLVVRDTSAGKSMYLFLDQKVAPTQADKNKNVIVELKI